MRECVCPNPERQHSTVFIVNSRETSWRESNLFVSEVSDDDHAYGDGAHLKIETCVYARKRAGTAATMIGKIVHNDCTLCQGFGGHAGHPIAAHSAGVDHR